MRGKHRNCRQYAYQHRITPADAGKTPSVKTITFTRQDHPRGCGENNVIDEIVTGIMGSPPRMRGKPNAPPDKHKANRDHPRGCGENVIKSGMLMSLIGSPPRMRGKRIVQPLYLPVARITPADAGKTTRIGFRQFRATDHPRGCGENTAIIPPMTATRGSPPRMRGKRALNQAVSGIGRITPADAGKTDTAPCVLL